jgi:hypothetical protein
MVHKSPRTIQMIELRPDIYRLTPELAEKISYETGVDMEWLLENDVSKPPITLQEAPYTKACFEFVQSINSSRLMYKSNAEASIVELQLLMVIIVARIGATALAAQESGNVNLFRWKLSRAIDELGHEFKANARNANALLAAWPPWRGETHDITEFKLDSMMKLLNVRFVFKELGRAKLKLNQLHRKVTVAERIIGAQKLKRRSS